MPTTADALDAWIDAVAARFPLRAWAFRRLARRRLGRVMLTAAILGG